MASKACEKEFLFKANLAAVRLLTSSHELREALAVLCLITKHEGEYDSDHALACEAAQLARKLSQATSRAMSLELFEGDHVKQK